MIFSKKEKDTSLDEKLKEIEEKVKGLGKAEQKTQQTEQPTSMPSMSEEKNIEEDDKRSEGEVQAPLFVKLDKYKNIVSSMMQLKTILISLKNYLMALEQIEKTRVDTFNAIMKNLDKMNEKLSTLEKEIVKPIGFSLGTPIVAYPTYEEIESVQASIANLKAQIEQLKAQLDSLE